jgi:hypothetical protein
MTHLHEGNGWFDGGNSQYPTNISSVSSFDALDAAIAYIADIKRFPMIQNIVLAGHSAGGQSRQARSIRIQVPDRNLAVQRYAILGNDPPQGVSLRYVIANPGSYAYFSSVRFKPIPDDCPMFNDWKYGLENYQLTYNPDFLSTDASRVQMRVRYLTREARYLYGTADLDAEDQRCQAKVQGAGHLERGQLFWKHITETYPGPWIGNIQKVEFVEGVGHDAAVMFKSKEGQTALFPL